MKYFNLCIIGGLAVEQLFKQTLGCLEAEIFSRIPTHQGPMLALVYPWYANTE